MLFIICRKIEKIFDHNYYDDHDHDDYDDYYDYDLKVINCKV